MADNLTLRQVSEGAAALKALIEADKKNKIVLSSAVRIKFAGNVRKTREPLEDYAELRTEKVKELGEEVADKPGSFKIKPENVKAWYDFENDALSAVTEVKFQPVTEAELFGDPDLGPEKQNQIDIDVLDVFKDVGILV